MSALGPLLPSWLRLLASVITFAAIAAACGWVAGRADEEAVLRTPATCVSTGCYCEADEPHGPREPVDAWSSLSPALAASVLLGFGLGGRPAGGTRLAKSRVPTMLLAGAAGSIAVFSFHYHATHTWLGEWLDGVSLYLLAGYAIAWATTRALGAGNGLFTMTYLLVAVPPAVLALLVPEARKVAFVVLVVLAVVVEIVGRRRARTSAEVRWLFAALGSFLVAATAWTLDWTRTVCYPQSWFQLHAVWHLLSAPTILALHAYFASERPPSL